MIWGKGVNDLWWVREIGMNGWGCRDQEGCVINKGRDCTAVGERFEWGRTILTFKYTLYNFVSQAKQSRYYSVINQTTLILNIDKFRKTIINSCRRNKGLIDTIILNLQQFCLFIIFQLFFALK